jgi:hypothetical protein
LLIAFKHITAIELDLPVIIFSTYDLFFTRQSAINTIYFQ